MNDQNQNEPSQNNDAPEVSNNDERSINPSLQKERDEYLDGWKRAKADLVNYKKEEARRLEYILMTANEQIIRELLAVLDSFDLALDTMEKESRAEKGVYLIRTQLEDALKKFGLERVPSAVGESFNPSTQEAIATVDSDQPSETVIEEVEKGYKLNGKLIRPARVKVAK